MRANEFIVETRLLTPIRKLSKTVSEGKVFSELEIAIMEGGHSLDGYRRVNADKANTGVK